MGEVEAERGGRKAANFDDKENDSGHVRPSSPAATAARQYPPIWILTVRRYHPQLL